jgi:DNA-binding transcriptional regulator YhcF (GntR family)
MRVIGGAGPGGGAAFRQPAGSDVPIYRQLVHEVRRDVMLCRLLPGDQLPSGKEIVDALSVADEPQIA